MNEIDGPYCPICTGCGEEDCCSPLKCDQSPDGKHCGRYLNDLKFGYKMHKWIEENIKFKEEDKEKLDIAFDLIYDEIYGPPTRHIIDNDEQNIENLKDDLKDKELIGRADYFFNNQTLLDGDAYKVMDEMLKTKIGNKPTKDRNWD